MSLTVRTVSSASDIEAARWDQCANPQSQAYHPLLRHDFFVALETSGSATANTGWVACHQIVQDGADILGVMPLYLKTHSQGEYVFDFAWADAFERAGGRYYPKLLSAIPFSPVTGPRLLTRSPERLEEIEASLLAGALNLLEEHHLSSLHINFIEEALWHRLGNQGFLRRKDQQFHWQNDGYMCFDQFLDALNARKRKNLRKERARALADNITVEWLTGEALRPAHWDDFYRFYLDTGRRKWGSPYLTRAFFDEIHHRMPEDILLIMAQRDGRYIAGALNFIGGDVLYGRNWGCIEDHPFLHFELCYYQAIDFAIEHGLSTVEAGAQGAHKIARGYAPRPTHSAHYIAHDGFREAVSHYLESEREYVDNDISELSKLAPFKHSVEDE